MTILDFQEQLPQAVLQKGKDYYLKGKVSDVLEINGECSAVVEGREEYVVNISTAGNYITHTSCTCKTFNYYDHCKHVAAVLFAMYGEALPDLDEAEPYLLGLLDKLPAEDMRFFLMKELLEDDALAERLMEFAETAIDSHGVYKHVDAINQSFLVSKTEKYDKYSSNLLGSKASTPTEHLLKKARTAYQSGDVTTAFDIIFAVISKLPAFNTDEQDEVGHYQTVVEEAFLLLDEICTTTELDGYNLRRLARKAAQGLWSEFYTIDDFSIHWLDILVKHGQSMIEKEEILRIIDSIADNAKKEEYGDSYARLMAAREAIAAGKGQAEKEIKEVPVSTSGKKKLLPIPEVAPPAEKKKPAPPSEKKLAYMKERADLEAQLLELEKEGPQKQYQQTQKELIVLMQQNNDIYGVRLFGSLFYKESGDPYFYEAIKTTYTNQDWENLVAGIK